MYLQYFVRAYFYLKILWIYTKITIEKLKSSFVTYGLPTVDVLGFQLILKSNAVKVK